MKTTDFIKLNEGIGEDAHNMDKDHEVQMAQQDCYNAARDAIALHKLLKNISEMQGLEGWVSEKLTLAADYLKSVHDYLEYELMSKHEGLPEFSIESAEQQFDQALNEEAGRVPPSHTIEAYGVRGMDSKPWRKSFKDHNALAAWCEKYDAEVHGTRALGKDVAEGDKKPYPKTWHDVDPKLGKQVDKMSQAEKVKKGLAHPDTLKKKGVAEGEYNPDTFVPKQMSYKGYGLRQDGPYEWSISASARKFPTLAAAKRHIDKHLILDEGFPYDVDHMPGPVVRDADMTTDNVKTKDKAEWDRAVDSINARVFDDMSEFKSDSKGERAVGNSAVWAKWDNATQTGWFNAKGRPLKPWPVKEATAGHTWMIRFALDTDRAYQAVMDRFGDVVEWDKNGNMMVPQRIWPKVGEVAFAADGIGADLIDESVTEDASDLNIGDPVIITGKVQYQGKTGDVVDFGKDKSFVVVDLYNHGKHSFQTSDVSFNEYADSEEEMGMKEDEELADLSKVKTDKLKELYALHRHYGQKDPRSKAAALRGAEELKRRGVIVPVDEVKAKEIVPNGNGVGDDPRIKLQRIKNKIKEYEDLIKQHSDGITARVSSIIAKRDRLVNQKEKLEKMGVKEDASAGASSAGAVATVVAPLMKKPIKRKMR